MIKTIKIIIEDKRMKSVYQLPTKHVTTVSRDFATVLFDISTCAIMNLGQLSHRCGQGKTKPKNFPFHF